MEKGTELTVKTPVVKMVEAIDAQLEKLVAVAQTPWKTSGNLNLGGETLMVKSEMKLDNLVRGLSSVRGREAMYNEALKAFRKEMPDIKSWPSFTIDGATADMWEDDLILRAKIVTQEETKKKLEEMKRRASEFMTVEDKKEAFLADLAAFTV